MMLHLNALQKKYPNMMLAALDNRSTTLLETGSAKDIFSSVPIIRARKPRSRDTVELSEFDEEAGALLSVGVKTVYYLPSSKNDYPTYRTNVDTSGPILDVVAEIALAALAQSESEHGAMTKNETRIFWIDNRQNVGPCSEIHATIVREHREYRLVAELRTEAARFYSKLLSIELPTEPLT